MPRVLAWFERASRCPRVFEANIESKEVVNDVPVRSRYAGVGLSLNLIKIKYVGTYFGDLEVEEAPVCCCCLELYCV